MKIDYSQLASLPLLSDTSHPVYSDGDTFMKTARKGADGSSIVREHLVLQELRPGSSELLPGPPVALLTEKMGEPVEEFEEKRVKGMLDYLYKVSTAPINLPRMQAIVPDFESLRERLERNIAYRVSQGTNARALLRQFPEKLTAPCSLVLTHSDPRPDNWLTDGDKPLLIDWESAIFAPWEFAVVSFLSHIFEADAEPLVDSVFTYASSLQHLDADLLRWSANMRSVSIASWYYHDEGKAEGDKWLADLTALWTRLGIL